VVPLLPQMFGFHTPCCYPGMFAFPEPASQECKVSPLSPTQLKEAITTSHYTLVPYGQLTVLGAAVPFCRVLLVNSLTLTQRCRPC
jgi:hypothetical protein